MKYLLLLILLFNLNFCVTQTVSNEEEFRKWQEKHHTLLNQARSPEDPQALVTILENILKEWEYFPETIKKENQEEYIEHCYNLACYRSLTGHETGAVEAFEMAVRNGWIDYRHTLVDSDLDNIRENPRFKELLQELREYDFQIILQKSEPYSTFSDENYPFVYQSADHPDLVRVRTYFNLDSIAGKGDEISQIKNLLEWVHNVIRHDGSTYNPDSRNAIDIIEICRKENRGVNCRMMAQVLNECYLAMGFKSRFVTCMPQVMVNDCHVINSVYSRTLGKWLWMDPTFNAYVADENGNLLSIAEVRQRLKDDLPLVLNKDANWNNESEQTKEYYLDYYMAKNLYYVICPLRSEFNTETWYEGKENIPYISLYPGTFIAEEDYRTDLCTNNEDAFWQSPL